jgi:hypothetical protein
VVFAPAAGDGLAHWGGICDMGKKERQFGEKRGFVLTKCAICAKIQTRICQNMERMK